MAVPFFVSSPRYGGIMITAENVVGLVVGEGCFYVESCPDSRYRLGWRIRPAFCIEMRAEEEGVLEVVRDLLGCGSVYHLDFGRYSGYEKRGWLPHVKYRVTRRRDLDQRVVPFFRQYPLFGRKAVAFEHFAKLVEILTAGLHRTPKGLDLAKEVADRLREHNRRGLLLGERTGTKT